MENTNNLWGVYFRVIDAFRYLLFWVEPRHKGNISFFCSGWNGLSAWVQSHSRWSWESDEWRRYSTEHVFSAKKTNEHSCCANAVGFSRAKREEKKPWKIVMKNKIALYLLSQVAFCANTNAQDENAVVEKVHYKIDVRDSSEAPIGGASVKIFNYSDEDVNQPKGKTNDEGSVSILANKTLLSEVTIEKDGYYPVASLEIPKEIQKLVDEPQQSFKVLLKSVRNPIALYAKNLTREGAGPLRVPVESQEIGYDLLSGDWVKPHGKGKTSDLIFFYESKFVDDSEFWRKISIRFSNEEDGLIPFEAPLHKGSQLVSNYQAPETGYLPEWNQVRSRIDQKPNETTQKEERNFYFRVRTELDEEGNIISAHYGKIYGDFMSFIYYFNPTPNDRNVEFATGKNLFRNLHWKEKVDRP